MQGLTSVISQLQEYFAVEFHAFEIHAVTGGDIHQSQILRLRSEENTANIPDAVFLKSNSFNNAEVLRSEYVSLHRMQELYPTIYPKPFFYQESNNQAVLVMEYIEISSLYGSNAASAGYGLAQQHQVTQENYGWDCSNFIGLTHQSNHLSHDWVDFFRNQRLFPMLMNAKENGISNELYSKVEHLLERLEDYCNPQTQAVLLHGDLWSGNLGYNSKRNQAVFYDPAPYFGDREVDLAMTELFGRLPAEFYQAYEEIFPLQDGYKARKYIYNLYHALNHVVLFGSGYNALVSNRLTGLYKNI